MGGLSSHFQSLGKETHYCSRNSSGLSGRLQKSKVDYSSHHMIQSEKEKKSGYKTVYYRMVPQKKILTNVYGFLYANVNIKKSG